jgi:hypothetical protein
VELDRGVESADGLEGLPADGEVAAVEHGAPVEDIAHERHAPRAEGGDGTAM